MNKKIVSLFLIVFTPLCSVSAHPGRTDSSGGHVCKTKCEKWGLEYGEYHHHEKKVKTLPSAKTQARREVKKTSKDDDNQDISASSSSPQN